MSSKKPKTKNIRHILESPFQIKWMEKGSDEILPIQNALRKLLPAAKLETTPLNLQFKRKEEEKGKTSKTLRTKNQNVYRSYLTPGFQSVVRGLERGELCSVVVSSDIAPVMLLRVILVQAQVSSVPVLVIPDLKPLTKSTLGFATMVLGFKNIVAESPEIEFNEIHQLIAQNPTVLEAAAYPIKGERQEESLEELNKESLKLKSLKSSEPVKPENFYLYRSANGKRAFTPEGNRNDDSAAVRSEVNTKMDDDFILIEKTSKSPKKPINMIKNVVKRVSDDDDDDSGDEINFFLDTKADNDLMERLQPKMEFGEDKINDGTDNNKTFHQAQNDHMKKKKKNKSKKRNMVDRLSHLSKVNFKPLQIKTVTGNSKRSKKKNKNKK